MKLTDRIKELQSIAADIDQQREHLQKSYVVASYRRDFYQSLMNAIEDAGGNPDAFTDIDSKTIGELADALSANHIRFIHQP